MADTNLFNILVIDKTEDTISSIQRILEHAPATVSTATSSRDAQKIINQCKASWHCWIVDIPFEAGSDDLSFLREHSYFPFVIAVSGEGNMRLAFEASKLGVLDIFDKNTSSPEELKKSIHQITALGLLLGGNRTDYLSTFLCLKEKVVLNPNEWAESAFIGLRYLENQCARHVGLSPRNVIPLYYYLCCLLHSGNATIDALSWQPFYPRHFHEFIESCIAYVTKRKDSRYNSILHGSNIQL